MMISHASFSAASDAIDKLLPSDLYLKANSYPLRPRLFDSLIVESDNEYWFDPADVDKASGLTGLSDAQINIKLYCGSTHCPKCKADLTKTFIEEGIRKEFGCSKCNYQWGVSQSDTPSKSHSRSPSQPQSAKPASGSVTGAVWTIADGLYENISEWKELRAEIISHCVKQGIHPSTAATQASKWRKFNAR